MTQNPEWWKGGLIYQIYPRSYMDSNDDGIGDLPGITAKLEHIASLGVDAIWLSPFFTSPMKDFGYDVADYCDVDPMFGTLDDFKTMLNRAHELGLKVIIDQVMSHSSDQHPWFQESRMDRTNPKADWYVWADPAPDGSHPNNWVSIFGGPAWQWDGRRRQYYLHNFLTEQPDLNFHNPEVRKASLDALRFWLDLGVDGFRLDVVNFYYHSKGLESNPQAAPLDTHNPGVNSENPYTYQTHTYDISQPENLDFLQELRALLDEYPGTTTVGEIGDADPVARMREYTSQKRLHMAYSFDLLHNEHSTDHIRKVIGNMEAGIEDGWPCWALSNHDVPRVATRWGVNEDPQKFPLAAMALLLSMRGSVCIYQGEELGLPEAEVPYERLQDPYGLNFWPEFKGRDGCRTPMVWTGESQGGFSKVEPWLPVNDSHLAYAVSEQEKAPDSILCRMRKLIQWRQQQPALVKGDLELLANTGDTIAYVRTHEEQSMVVAINLTGQTQEIDLSTPVKQVYGEPGFESQLQGNRLSLPPYQAFFGELA